MDRSPKGRRSQLNTLSRLERHDFTRRKNVPINRDALIGLGLFDPEILPPMVDAPLNLCDSRKGSLEWIGPAPAERRIREQPDRISRHPFTRTRHESNRSVQPEPGF